MFRGLQTPPSYHQGFARNASESAYPETWKGLIGAFFPSLGVTGITTLRDWSGRRNDGTFGGTPTAAQWIIGGNPKAPGYAINFNGTSHKIEVDPVGAAINVSEGTIALWCKLNAVSANAVAFHARVDGSNEIELQWLNSSNVFRFKYVADGTVETLSTSDVTEDSTWRHIAMTWSVAADEVKYYINGTQAGATDTALGAWSGTLSTAAFGVADDADAKFWNGPLNDMLIYDRPLNASEIALLYRVSNAPVVLRPRLAVKAAAAAAGLSIPVAMSQYRRQYNTTSWT